MTGVVEIRAKPTRYLTHGMPMKTIMKTIKTYKTVNGGGGGDRGEPQGV